MAPRRRPVKKGESRMDAALDAMAPFGFDKKLVHQTVHKLLKVYDGKEGWVFIEDGAYRLLIDQILEAQKQDQEEHINDLNLINEFHPEMRREDLPQKDSMYNYTGRITRSKGSCSSQKFNSLSVGTSSGEKEDKENDPLNYTGRITRSKSSSEKFNYVDGLVDKDPSCLVSRLTTLNPKVRKNPDMSVMPKQLGFDDGEKTSRDEISTTDLKEGSQGMSPDKEPLALSEPLKLVDDDTQEVLADSFSEAVIDNGLHNPTDNSVTNFNVRFPFGAPTDEVNVNSEQQVPNTVSSGQNGDLVKQPLLSNGEVTGFSTDFNNFKSFTEGFTNDVEHSCSQHKRRKIEIETEKLLPDSTHLVRKEEASISEKKKAASNYYSTTYSIDELVQSKSWKKELCSPLEWDSSTKHFVDTLVDATKKDQANKMKKEEDTENKRS